ncbi:hypothetical protein BU24DRAFT_105054 [Aaosphaeria arxii CBS 175.79]|uniref:Uncharacterized protein n=1 Tax=Aaosphaeria arxii CBS 175.79 TaxID=1450172 RepID=A0A6A5Y2I0_9PLEO|nr:uncharacterized protein BU24DRAFT_105054 [Aaosphaeria arxii CBS 175.79]KAF2018784.1 hypothetical protein BU24DRAFT_105054 [Aaosphaeria arxii CBS 175.79]
MSKQMPTVNFPFLSHRSAWILEHLDSPPHSQTIERKRRRMNEPGLRLRQKHCKPGRRHDLNLKHGNEKANVVQYLSSALRIESGCISFGRISMNERMDGDMSCLAFLPIPFSWMCETLSRRYMGAFEVDPRGSCGVEEIWSHEVRRMLCDDAEVEIFF